MNAIHSWLTEVQFLLRAYSTNENIRVALGTLRNVTQKGWEKEAEYSLRIQRSHARGGYCLPP